LADRAAAESRAERRCHLRRGQAQVEGAVTIDDELSFSRPRRAGSVGKEPSRRVRQAKLVNEIRRKFFIEFRLISSDF